MNKNESRASLSPSLFAALWYWHPAQAVRNDDDTSGVAAELLIWKREYYVRLRH